MALQTPVMHLLPARGSDDQIVGALRMAIVFNAEWTSEFKQDLKTPGIPSDRKLFIENLLVTMEDILQTFKFQLGYFGGLKIVIKGELSKPEAEQNSALLMGYTTNLQTLRDEACELIIRLMSFYVRATEMKFTKDEFEGFKAFIAPEDLKILQEYQKKHGI